MTAISEPLASFWHVVVLARCRSRIGLLLNVKWTECESPSKRTYWACQLHPILLQIDLPRLETSDKASSAEAGCDQTQSPNASPWQLQIEHG